jgi:transcription elongation factor GreA
VPGSREQERCIELLRESFGDDNWLDEVEQALQHAPPGMVRGLVEALEEAGRLDVLARHYGSLLARPTNNPFLLVRLAERIESKGVEVTTATPQQRAQCLLQLSVHLHVVTSSNSVLLRSRTKLASLLTSGRPPLLRRLLQDCDTDTLKGLARLLEKGVDRSIDRLFTKVAIELSPDIFRSEDDRAFWNSANTWTTRAGMAARQEELRVLRDVKIPDNAEAIGRAASYGDLSENAEWTAALEEQRNLTTRAMQLENDLENARLIENAILPVDIAAPGTRVKYRELPDGDLQQIDILGPWDSDGETRISYRSPLANGMLGQEPGDEFEIKLPTTVITVRLESVQPIVF